jgi:cytochrome c peroxidase
MKKNSISFSQILKSSLLLGFTALIFIVSCKKDVAIADSSNPSEISFAVPQDWPTPFYNFENNTLTPAGFALGRKLFYDTRLSKDNTISCGTCHQSYVAFANANHRFSHGINDLLGKRNAPALFNLNWHTSFMWDGGINHIEVQPLGPITNPIEMAETIANVVNKINADATYKQMFLTAYGSTEINSEKMLKALAQFMGAIVSSNSRYDKYMRQETDGVLNSSELAGLAVYQAKCAICHKAPLFTDYTFRNIGLTPTSAPDSGRAHITQNPADLYAFKVPTLRNLAYTAPYMHDGRFNTIDQVFDQMQSGIYVSPSLDTLMKKGITLSAQERIDLKSFLNSLNDESLVQDKRFQEPK